MHHKELLLRGTAGEEGTGDSSGHRGMDGGEGTDGVVPEGGQQLPICNRFISAWRQLCPEIWGISGPMGPCSDFELRV